MLYSVSAGGGAGEATIYNETEESAGAAVTRDIEVVGWKVYENAGTKAAATFVLEDGDKKVIGNVVLAASGNDTTFVPQPGEGGLAQGVLCKGPLKVKRTGEVAAVVYIKG